MKKSMKIILCALAALALAAAALAAVRVIRHEKDQNEALRELAEQLALSHPEISIRFIVNGQNRFSTGGTGS